MTKIEQLKAIAELERLKVKAIGSYIVEPNEDDAEDEEERDLSPAGIRMVRKRKRERNARLFWELRLKTGTSYWPLIEDASKHAPAIIEAQRVATIDKMKGWARAYPERCEAI